jgi:adiponectin receptor
MAIGFVFYHFYIPERWFIGSFDIIGGSHQWWHVFTMLGPLLQVFTGIEFMEWMVDHPCKA